MKEKIYKIRLVGYHAFSDGEGLVEAYSDTEALNKAKELYPEADSYLIEDIKIIN